MDFITAARLVELRKKNGYSQETLAEKLGLSRQAISKWERAESSPDTDNLIALASLYGMTLDALLNPGAPEQAEASQAVKAPADTEALRSDTDTPQIEEREERPSPGEKKTLRRERLNKKKSAPAVFPKAALFLKKFPYIIIVAAVFVLLGYYKKLWHPGWVLFVSVPVYYGFAFACSAKSMRSFRMRIPVIFIAAFVYLCLGFGGGLWHPYWVLFLIVPAYYWIASGKKHVS
ncbi:MAG: helix-turn-helix domain-containing protein [Clostridiales bacterium]|nr:helix-turn-helix domain-containing protein [Clostridiales bacterium]